MDNRWTIDGQSMDNKRRMNEGRTKEGRRNNGELAKDERRISDSAVKSFCSCSSRSDCRKICINLPSVCIFTTIKSLRRCYFDSYDLAMRLLNNRSLKSRKQFKVPLLDAKIMNFFQFQSFGGNNFTNIKDNDLFWSYYSWLLHFLELG